MANENTGQEESADVSQGISQDEPGTGQELKTETPAVDLTDSIVKAAIKAGESAASEKPAGEPTGEPAGDEKPAPYDKDPKWLAARAAEKSLQEILSDNDIEDVEELKTMLKSGLTIKEIVGDRDAKQLIQDADTLKNYNAYWAEQERLKEDEDLDPDKRAEKYKTKLEDYEREQSDKQAEKAKIEAGKQAIENYNGRIESLIEKQSLDGESAEIAKMFLGVNNPFNNVDISDPKAVKAMATEGIAKFSTFLEKVRQTAIDDYAAGKSKIIPITSTDAPEGSPSTTKKELPKDASVEQTFNAAKNELFELLAGGTSP